MCPLPMSHIAHVSKRCQIVKKMSNVKKSKTWTMEEVHWYIHWTYSLSQRFKSQTARPVRKSTKINNIGSIWNIWWSAKTFKIFIKCFWPLLMTFICDVKVDLIMCEPPCVKLFFLLTSSKVQLFWHLSSFDVLTLFFELEPPQLITELFFVYQMEFDQTRWSCWWNSTKNYTKLCQGHFYA